MRRFASALAAGFAITIPAAGLAAPASAATAAPAAAVRVKVVGVDRNGHVIGRQQATLEAVNGQSYQVFGNSVRIPAGTYLIGGAVLTGEASETLVVRQVRVTRSETVRLSAAGGKLVRAALTGVSGVPDTTQVTACLGTRTDAETPVYASGGGESALYAVPFRSRDVGFSYLASWQRSPAGYAISGSFADGIPARVSFRQRVSALARLTVNVRSGDSAATDDLWSIGPGNSFHALCTPGMINATLPAPFSLTTYVTAGTWTTRVDGDYVNSRGQSFDIGLSYLVRKLAARKAYRQVFGVAVAGPRPIQPAIDGNLFRFGAADLFDIPGVQDGGECCARSTVALSLGRHKLWTAHLNEWRGRSYLQRTVTRAGWYNFDVSAARWNPRGSEPADLLSPRATIHWHFYIRPVAPAGDTVDFPVTVTAYEPRGLSSANQARPGAATTIEFQIARNSDSGDVRARQYPFRTVRVLASFNGGTSWHQVTISRHGSNWLAVVHDPASGYVALRSVVTDTKGDSTTQTIYRAYAIAG